ncbi:MAG: protein translocase subunit SecD [bacterium]|nr:protein translocase subunit SecD [bacterium]
MSRRRLWITLVITLAVAWGSLAGTLSVGWTPKLGLDLQGGFAVVLTAPEGADPDVLDKAVEIMRQRIENLGSVQEPEISVQGDASILVQLPGVQDRERALQAVGTTGELSFRPVLDSSFGISPAFFDGTLPVPEEFANEDNAESDEPTDESTTTSSTTTTTTTTLPPVIPDNIDPETGLTIVDDPAQDAYLLGEDGITYYHVGGAFLLGSDIEGATASFIGTISAGWVVDPDFSPDGGDKFEAATAQLTLFSPGDPRRSMAIVVDGEVVSAPQVSEQLATGEALDADVVYITVGGGDEQQQEAEDLSTILRYGALPTTFERERVESVSASLGSDSLRAGLIAGVGGLILVGFALLLYYRALGLIAIIGLSVFGSLLVVIISLMSRFQGTTLTLAGVTGIIVSIGITSDSYIVFFERIKEEHRRGRPLRTAVDHGFSRALHTILTADTVTFVGSILLWILAIGPVKGFAITLGIATVIDVIVAYFFTRPAAALLVRSRLGEGGWFSIRAASGRSKDEIVAEAIA